MSTLRVADIQSNGTGFNDVVSFKNASGTENGTLCRAWVNFDGTFGTSPFTEANGGIRASFNVSSITDGGTGVYTVNFTNLFSDTNYSAVGNASWNGATYGNTVWPHGNEVAAGSFGFRTGYTNSSFVLNDALYVYLAFFR